MDTLRENENKAEEQRSEYLYDINSLGADSSRAKAPESFCLL